MRPAIPLIALSLICTPWSVSAQGESAETDRSAEIDAMEPALSGSDLTAAGETPSSQRADSLRGPVMDEIDLGRTEITGNQELPKVLYIVPWKQSDLGDLVGRPVNSLLDEVLAPVDREVFARQVSYYQHLYVDSLVDDEAGHVTGDSQ